MLKHNIYLGVILFCAVIISGCARGEKQTVTISGQIKNIPKGYIALTLEEDINRKVKRVISSIPVDENGRFAIELKLVPHIYSLNIREQRSVMLAIDIGQKISISGDANDPAPLLVTGSEDTARLGAYENFRRESLNRLVITVRERIRELTEKNTTPDDPQMIELGKLEIENYSKHKNEMMAFVRNEMGTSIAVYATSIRWDGDDNLPFLNDLARRFEIDHPNLDVTRKLIEKVKILTNNSVGGKVPDISMPDKNGKIIRLSSISAKYILIDFWGSWCGPCRRESRELAGLYQKYRSQGFEIYGVGLESEKDAWLSAIAQDRRDWTNVLDLKEFEAPAAFDYGVTSLPANFLIDSEGHVIAKNLHDDELRGKIDSLFK